MKRRVKIGILVVSHLGVFVFAGATSGGYLIQRQFGAAMADPNHRVGLRFSGFDPDTEAKLPPLEQDLRDVSERVQEPASEVLRLVVHLRGGRLDEAADACKALRWPRCDHGELTKMREAIAK
jgi:hypothetical protein